MKEKKVPELREREGEGQSRLNFLELKEKVLFVWLGTKEMMP